MKTRATKVNQLYPITYNGVVYTEKNVDEVFECFYTCREAVLSDGSVYMSDNMYVFPDGEMVEED